MGRVAPGIAPRGEPAHALAPSGGRTKASAARAAGPRQLRVRSKRGIRTHNVRSALPCFGSPAMQRRRSETHVFSEPERSRTRECRFDRRDGEKKMQFSIDQRDEAVFLVESLRLLVDSVYFNGRNAKLISQAGAALKGIQK